MTQTAPNQAYCSRAISGELQKLRDAGSGATNDTLFPVACRLFQFVNAGVLSETDAEQQLWDIARSKGHADQSIRDTLKSARKTTGGQVATIPAPTITNGNYKSATIRGESVYTDLANYEQSRGVLPGTYTAAGWADTILWEVEYAGQQGVKQTTFRTTKPAAFCRERRALAFSTSDGMRYRFIDGLQPKYWHRSGTHTDQRKGWYRLPEALAIAQQTSQVLTLCNGESSVIAAQAHGVAATCLEGGGEREIPAQLLSKLQADYSGAIRVALDCDNKGRAAMPKLRDQLKAAGYEAHAVDLGGSLGFDLADFCKLHENNCAVELAHPDRVIPEVAADATSTGHKLLHASQLGTIPPTTWLIDGVLAMNKLSETFAPPGSGKSFLELDKALCVAKNYSVIYVAAEAVEDYEERVAAWEAQHGVKAGQLYFWPEPIMLRDLASVDAFLTEIHPIMPAAIFLDPLASCKVGLEESSTGDMTIAVEALNRIRRETGAAVHIVHHTGWSDAHERGSSVLRAACRIVMKLSLDDSGLMTLTCEKANNGKPFDARYFRLVSAGSSAVLVPANKIALRDAPLSVRQLTILEALEMTHFRDGASFTQIAEHTNLAKSTVNKAISALLGRGYISTEGNRTKSYRLAQKGSDELLLRLAGATVGANAPVHKKSELEMNWAVNNQMNNANNPHQHAEFIEFTMNRAKTATVQQRSEQNTSPLSTSDSAPESASSPEFTPGSPSVHAAGFTSSPLAPPLGGEESELPPSKPIRLRDGTIMRELILTNEYQDVPDGWLVPPGADIILGVGTDTVRKARRSQTSSSPQEGNIDWKYVHQMLAIGGEAELKAIRTHCSLKHADYNEVIALAQSSMVSQAQA